jgi:hypothetical protein
VALADVVASLKRAQRGSDALDAEIAAHLKIQKKAVTSDPKEIERLLPARMAFEEPIGCSCQRNARGEIITTVGNDEFHTHGFHTDPLLSAVEAVLKARESVR